MEIHNKRTNNDYSFQAQPTSKEKGDKTAEERKQVSSQFSDAANEALVSRGKAIVFRGREHSEDGDCVSQKALDVLNKNGYQGVPVLKNIVSEIDKITDVFECFQRKLGIDRLQYKGKDTENIYDKTGNITATIEYGSDGKPKAIKHFSKSGSAFIEEFEYATRRDGSTVLSKENIYLLQNGSKIPVDSVKYHKHHNGDVTITNQAGDTLSYNLRRDELFDVSIKASEKPVETKPEEVQDKPAADSVPEAPKVERKELFTRPEPNYPVAEYTERQKYIIREKFKALRKEVESSPTQFDSRGQDLDNVEKIIWSIKDPVLQQIATKAIDELSSNIIPTQFAPTWSQIDFNDSCYGWNKIGEIINLQMAIDKDFITVDENGVPRPKPSGLYQLDSRNDVYKLKERLDPFINNKVDIETGEPLTDEEYNSQLNKEIYSIGLENTGYAIGSLSNYYPEFKTHLYNTYILGSLSEKQAEGLKQINEAIGKPQNIETYGRISANALANFADLPEETRAQFLRNPALLSRTYLSKLESSTAYQVESPYETLKSLTPEDWKIFNERNINDIIDVVIGVEKSRLGSAPSGKDIRKIISTDEETWKKIQDFDLFGMQDGKEHLFRLRKNESLKFSFDEITYIADNVSYKDWENIKNRGVLDLECYETPIFMSSHNNGGSHIGVRLISALGKIPDSTFDFLKHDLNLFENNKFNIQRYKGYTQQEYIAKGITHLAASHGGTYERTEELKRAGFDGATALEIVGISAENYGRFGNYVKDRAIELKEKGINQYEVPDILPLYTDLQMVRNKANINELSIDEKRTLLKKLTKYNALFFNHDFKSLLESDIVPKDKEEYCKLLPKLVKSVGLDTRPVSPEVIDNFEKAMAAMSEPNSEFLNTQITKDNFKLELEYSRKDFIEDVQEATIGLPDKEKMKVYDYFGFELKTDKNGTIQMNGYPINVNNGAKLAEIESEKTKNIIETLRPIVEKFSHENKVTIEGKPELTKQINDIVALFPELKSIIGKEQHDTHDYTLDVHILKVLQGVMSNPEYKNLSEKDKKLLNIATLMHDLTKAEKLVDKTHPQTSAFDTYYLLQKMNMPEADKVKVYQLIKNHDWLEKYNGKVPLGNGRYRDMTPEERTKAAKDIAFELREGDNFKMAAILAEADTKGVKESGAFFDRYSGVLARGVREVSGLVDQLKKTAIHLPQTKIPKASEMKSTTDQDKVYTVTTQGSDGSKITNKVLYLEKGMDLEKYGFEKGLKSDDLNVVVHALENESQAMTLEALGLVDSDALLSTSYVNYRKGNYHVFRPQGFILDINSTDIQAGTYKDFGSGYGKDLETLKSDYLFGGRRHKVRDFLSDKLKMKLKMSDEEYKKFFDEIADKSITEIERENPKYADAFREVFDEMDIHKRRYGRDYNEFLVSRPKIQAVFFEGNRDVRDIPEFLRKYAEENDLPIIYFGS